MIPTLEQVLLVNILIFQSFKTQDRVFSNQGRMIWEMQEGNEKKYEFFENTFLETKLSSLSKKVLVKKLMYFTIVRLFIDACPWFSF